MSVMRDSFSYSSRSFCSLLRFRPSSELRYDRSGLFCPASDMCGLTAPREDLHIRCGIYSTDAEHTRSCNNHANSKQRHHERGQQEPRNLKAEGWPPDWWQEEETWTLNRLCWSQRVEKSWISLIYANYFKAYLITHCPHVIMLIRWNMSQKNNPVFSSANNHV